MTKEEFEEQLDSLIEGYICENDDYEDINICHTTTWRDVDDEWLINVDIFKQKK